MEDGAFDVGDDEELGDEVQLVIKRWERMGYTTPDICAADDEIIAEARDNIRERDDFVAKGILPEDYEPTEYSAQPVQVGRFNLVGRSGFDAKVSETNFDTFDEALKALAEHPSSASWSMGIDFDDGVNKHALIWSEWQNDGANHQFKYISDHVRDEHAEARGQKPTNLGVLPQKASTTVVSDNEYLDGLEPPEEEAPEKGVLPEKVALPPKLTVVSSNDDPSLDGLEPPDDLELGDDEDLEDVLPVKNTRGKRITARSVRTDRRTPVPDDDDAVIEEYPDLDVGEGGWIESGIGPDVAPDSVPSLGSPGGQAFGLPESVEDRYLVTKGNQKQELYLRNEKLPAIVDRGNSLRALGSDTATVRDIVDIAIHREWQLLKLRGSKQFRKEAWIEATVRGLKVEGYTPKDVDIQEAIARGSELSDSEQVAERGGPIKQGLASIKRGLEKAMSSSGATTLGERHVPAGPSDNWFDLGPLGAKLERLPVNEESGEYYLRLEIDEDKFVPDMSEGQFRDAVQDGGWVGSKDPAPEGKVAIETYQSAQSAREIARKVSVWFDHDVMKSAHKPLRDHVDPPRVFGLVRANTEAELAQLVAGVDLGDKTRIQNTLALCLSKSEQMREQAEKALFSGNGNQVFAHLVDSLKDRSVNAWPELEAASFTRGLMEAAGQNPSDQTAKMMTELGQLLRDDETDAIAAMTDGILRDTEGYAGNDAVSHPAMNEGIYARVARDVRFAQRADYSISPSVIALGQMEGARFLSAAAMSGNSEINKSNAAELLDEARSKLPFNVRADGSTPTTQVAESVVAMERAVSAASSAFGRSSENLLNSDGAMSVRLSNENVSANEQVVGYHTHLGEGEDRAKSQALANSVRSGRSFIHELGHAVSRNWGFSDAEKEACLAKSGALAKMHDEIDARFPTEDVDSRGYYRDTEEMFARMFDAHVCNTAREAGDKHLDSVGGVHTTTGYDIGVPHGDIAATSAFAEEVGATIERKLEAANTQQLAQQKGREASQSSAAGPAR